MNISKVCFGYYENGNFRLKSLLMNDDQYESISKKLVIKDRNLPSLRASIENTSNNNKKFSIKDIDEKEDINSYQLELIKTLYNDINQNTEYFKKIEELNDSNYQFIVYLGDTDAENQKLGVIFPVKKNILFKSKKILMFFDSKKATSKAPNLKSIPSDPIIQLPHENSISTFYVKTKDDGKNIFKLNVFKPVDFDDVFNTNLLKNSFARKTLDRFTSSDEKLKLTSDGLNVSFVKNNDDEITNKIKSRDELIDTLANFSGNGHCTIQNINKNKLNKVLEEMKDYASTDAECNYDVKNIPKIKQNDLLITVDSLPIFCSLLNNHVIKKLLTDTIRVPYYDKYNE